MPYDKRITSWAMQVMRSSPPRSERMRVINETMLHMIVDKSEDLVFDKMRLTKPNTRPPLTICFAKHDPLTNVLVPIMPSNEVIAKHGPIPSLDEAMLQRLAGDDGKEAVHAADAAAIYADKIDWIQRVCNDLQPYAVLIIHPYQLVRLKTEEETIKAMQETTAYDRKPATSLEEATARMRTYKDRVSSIKEALGIYCMSPIGTFVTLRGYRWTKQNRLEIWPTAKYIDMDTTKVRDVPLLQAWSGLKPWWPATEGGHGN